MEPRREQQQPKPEEPCREDRSKRFRILKLEERLAPKAGGKMNSANPAGHHTCGGGTDISIYCLP